MEALMDAMNLTQYEQMQKKMDKILDIFKFEKDDWVCNHEDDDEIKENIIDMKANMEQLDSGHDFTADRMNDLETKLDENKEKLDEIIDILKSNNAE
jgi:hypothetical protein